MEVFFFSILHQGYFYAQNVPVLPVDYIASIYDYSKRLHQLSPEIKKRYTTGFLCLFFAFVLSFCSIGRTLDPTSANENWITRQNTEQERKQDIVWHRLGLCPPFDPGIFRGKVNGRRL